jgi:hypothetical protein
LNPNTLFGLQNTFFNYLSVDGLSTRMDSAVEALRGLAQARFRNETIRQPLLAAVAAV